ncbi:MAG: hypothetical protein K6T37_04615, partial [Acidothermus cellulolyticus]|nr:hypothetical protein [Acidothermus cellulolyticus]
MFPKHTKQTATTAAIPSRHTVRRGNDHLAPSGRETHHVVLSGRETTQGDWVDRKDGVRVSDRIVDAKVIVTCPGRNFVTLKLTTADGVTGLGDATLNGRELAVATYLQEYVCPLLLGRDPAQINDTWQYLYRGAYWRRGPVTMASIAAVDMALWDIKAKTAGMPLYQLLGGRARDGVTVYGHANGRDIPEVLDEVAAFLERGYKAVRVQVGIPGLGAVYGVSKDRTFYEPATGTDRPEETR